MACSYCYCKAVNTGAVYKLFDLFRTGVGGVLRRNVYLVLNARKLSKLALYGNIVLMGIFDDLAGKGYISSSGRWLPSIITDVKPPSMQATQVS